jgi:hypothetical protein
VVLLDRLPALPQSVRERELVIPVCAYLSPHCLEAGSLSEPRVF